MITALFILHFYDALNWRVLTCRWSLDLPILLKAVDIIQSKGLTIVPRLGGFHLLKSFLGTFGSIFADSGIHDDEELTEMKIVLENVKQNLQGVNCKDFPITDIFRSKIQNKFEDYKNAGRTPALWVLYHYMVDTIKIFIRAEQMGDFSLHLSCIANRMLHVFAAAGHHYAKAARLYVQLMTSYEQGSPNQFSIIKSFKSSGSHVVRFRNGESVHRCWVQTLSHMSLINRLSSEKIKSKNIHRDLAAAQRSADEKAILMINHWLEEMQSFDETRDKDVLISFSTGFFSRGDDSINPEKALDVGKDIHIKIDGQVPSAKIENKYKVQPLSNLRQNVISRQANSQVCALKYFNRLVIFAQRESNLEKAFEHKLAPFPLSFFFLKKTN